MCLVGYCRLLLGYVIVMVCVWYVIVGYCYVMLLLWYVCGCYYGSVMILYVIMRLVLGY